MHFLILVLPIVAVFGMSFKVKGLDEIVKELEKMQYGLSLEGINSYCERVKKVAINCGINRNEIVLGAHRTETDELKIICSLQDKDKRECLRQAIAQVLPSMPPTMKPLFEHLSCNLEDEKS